MIDFTNVAREFRSLIDRRRELFTLLGSVFAAVGLLMENVLQGKLPPSLAALETRIFATFALLLMVPALLISLRIARLHAGMTLNGVLFARLMQEQNFTRKGNPESSSKLNILGVSTLMFVLTDFIAASCAVLLALSLQAPLWVASAAGIGVFIIWMTLFIHFHGKAAEFALGKARTETCAPFTREQWHEHISGSLQDTNAGMLSWISFVGLIVFSVFTSLSGLGQMKAEGLDLASSQVQEHAPTALGVMMAVTAVAGLVSYIRLRIAIGRFSLQLDPTDRPFQPGRLTDSLLGYMLLAFLFAVAMHVLLFPMLGQSAALLGIDIAAFLGAVAAEQISLVVAGAKFHEAPPAPVAAQPTPVEPTPDEPTAEGTVDEPAPTEKADGADEPPAPTSTSREAVDVDEDSWTVLNKVEGEQKPPTGDRP